MRKSLLALVVIASLALASACGSTDGSDGASSTKPTTSTSTSTTVPAVAIGTWAENFCDGFVTWFQANNAASEKAVDASKPGDVEGAKQSLTELFASASANTQALITSLEEGGEPDVEDAAALVEDLTARFQAFDEAAQAAKADAEALKVGDAATFNVAKAKLIAEYQTEVSKVSDSFAEIDAEYPSDELNAALAKSCTF